MHPDAVFWGRGSEVGKEEEKVGDQFRLLNTRNFEAYKYIKLEYCRNIIIVITLTNDLISLGIAQKRKLERNAVLRTLLMT